MDLKGLLKPHESDSVKIEKGIALMLEARNITVNYGTRTAVANISLRDAGSGVLRWMIGAKR